MNELLQATAKALSLWLGTSLPSLSANWWTDLVIDRLSDTQRTQLERRQISSLADLDLAALLRVLDQNWLEFAHANPSLNRDARTWLKELQSARNRWAHPPAGGVSNTDAFRDADTLERFLKALGVDEDLLTKIEAFKAKCLGALTPTTPEPPPAADARVAVRAEQPALATSQQQVEHSPAAPPMPEPHVVLATVPEPARRVTRVWPSKTGSQYKNVGIEAHVVEVEGASPKIVLTYVDESGDQQTVEDFGRDGKFEQVVFDYLKDNEGRRAFFILTKRPGDRTTKLASNTMMLSEYRHHWQTRSAQHVPRPNGAGAA